MGFDAVKAVEATTKWIRDWFEANGPGCNAIVGISGGKDSSIAAALCCEALGKDRVIGVLMPNGEQSDIDMAKLLVGHLGIEHYIINIKGAFDSLTEQIGLAGIEISRDSIINLPPRLRMSTLYAVGQSRNGRVVNTCNLSEDWVGYSTRYGDSVGDFSPMSCFTTAEIRAMARLVSSTRITVTFSGTSTRSMTTRTAAPAAAASPANVWPSKDAPFIHRNRQPASSFRESFTTAVTSTSRLPCIHS